MTGLFISIYNGEQSGCEYKAEATDNMSYLIDGATNDRAFYIYLDEATDGYTMENNWCPAERFDSNRPGKKNVWKNNGPQVADSIKYKAGRIKQD